MHRRKETLFLKVLDIRIENNQKTKQKQTNKQTKSWKQTDLQASLGKARLIVCVGQLLVFLSTSLVDVPSANK